MSYQGNKPATSFESPKKDRFTGISGTTCSLTHAVSSVSDIIVWVNSVKQDFTNYSVSGSTLTLGGTLVSADIVEVTYVGRTYQSVNPNDASVGANQVQASIITGQTALGATPADTDELLISDAGTLKRVDYSYLKSTVVNRPNVNPLIINGNMAVAQRGTSKTGVTNGDFGIWTCDRWNFTESGTMSAVIDITQESLTSGNAYTDGFSKAYKIDVTTADGSLAADDYYRTNYRIEGQDLQLFKKGTANAEKITLAFWVKATKTGTNIVELNDNDNGRHCCASYTISTTNTWEKKVLNFPADTTGAWDNDNGQSLRINFILAAGSNYTSGTLDTTWAANTTANIAVGQVNNFDSTSNNVHITGVQLEVGEYTSSTLPPFQHESYGDNLARCQRYYYFHASEATNGGTDTQLCTTTNYNTSQTKGVIFFPRRMRAKPTLKQNTGSNMYRVYSNNANATMDSLALATGGTENYGVVYNGTSISVTAGTAGNLETMDSTAYVAFDSEL